MSMGDFTPQADAYSRARPTYPAEIVDRLIAEMNVAAGDPVVDFGAGTGIFTGLLVDRGLVVTALEPNAEMRVRNNVPEAAWRNGTFENSSLADASQKWAVAAQAFHWADPPRALPEVKRILQPGGHFTILWNNRANRESEVLGWTEECIRRHVPDFDEAYRNRPWKDILESTGDFCVTSEIVVRHVVRMSRERYLNLWKSHNRLTTTAGPERFAALLADIENYLKRQHASDIDVPYRCEAWTAQRS
jgi:SAM-dependent methyltransferase